MAKAATKLKKEITMEEALWKSADKLRGSVEPAEYKHVVLSLFFLKFASDKFEAQRKAIAEKFGEKFIDNVAFYTKDNVFFLPEESRWSYIIEHAKLEGNAQFCSMCGSGIELNEGKGNSISKGGQSHSSKFSKILIVALSVFLLLSVALNVVQIVLPYRTSGESKPAGNEQTEQGKYDELVESAIESLKIKWIGLYKDSEDANGYLEIFHTRVIDVTPNESDTVFQEMDRGMEIDYIVEFSLYSDYFSTAPYYHNAATYDTVIVYEDGTTSVASNFSVYIVI